MTRTRNIGIYAAIGGLTATIALLTGLPAANADELADLKANQELLQRRIEQLAQGTNPYPEKKAYPGLASPMGAQATPGAALIGGSFPRSFLIPGTDTSIRVGGFIDLTGLYYLQGQNASNPGTPSSNSGQNGNLNSLPIGQQFVPGLGSVRAADQPFARQRGVPVQPAANEAQRRDPHPDRLGRVADVFRVRLGGRQQFQCPDRAAGRRRQPGPAPQIRLRHVGRVPRRPGPLEFLRCRRRHRIN